MHNCNVLNAAQVLSIDSAVTDIEYDPRSKICNRNLVLSHPVQLLERSKAGPNQAITRGLEAVQVRRVACQ
jgi:hypothetical protein